MSTRTCSAPGPSPGRRDEPSACLQDTRARHDHCRGRTAPDSPCGGYHGAHYARGAVLRVFESVELTDIRNDDLNASSNPNGDGQQGEARSQVKIVIPADHSMVSLLGSGDELLHVIEREFDADIHVRGNEITATGTPAETALVTALFDELVELLRKGAELSADAVERAAAMLRAERGVRPADVLTVGILSARGRTIRPKTLNQKRYADAIDEHTIVFAIGPAGTGKTYLAMAKAVKALQAKQVNRIILTRPAVEAGERLGFLPGTLYEKIAPYLRPLYDALHDMLDPDSIPKLMAAGTIEIAPLAYMRGRCQPTDTPVLTPDGFRTIGSLAVGDLVIGSNGKPTPVIGVYPQGEKDIYRLTTQDGASTLCSGDHLWAVATRADRRRGTPLRVLPTSEMIGTRLGAAAASARHRGPAEAGTRLPAEPDTGTRGRHHPGEPGDPGGAAARTARHAVHDKIRARSLPVQLGEGPAGRPPGPARHRRRPRHAAGPDLPRPVHDHLAVPAR